MTDVTKATLTPAKQRLIELMQEIRYGRIERLEVLDWEPVLDPPPRVVRQIVFGKENGSHTARNQDGFALKKSVAELLDVLDRERSLSIQELVINDGLAARGGCRCGYRRNRCPTALPPSRFESDGPASPPAGNHRDGHRPRRSEAA